MINRRGRSRRRRRGGRARSHLPSRWRSGVVALAITAGLLVGGGVPASAAVEPVRTAGAGPVIARGASVLILADPTPTPTETSRIPQPIEVTPDWHDLPAKDRIMSLLDTLSQLALVCCVAVAIIGGAALGIGKVTGSAPSGIRGTAMLLGGGGGAIIIVYAPDLISWLAQ